MPLTLHHWSAARRRWIDRVQCRVARLAVKCVVLAHVNSGVQKFCSLRIFTMSAEQEAVVDARIDESEIPSSSESEWSDADAELGSVEDGDWELARGGESLLTRLYEAVQ